MEKTGKISAFLLTVTYVCSGPIPPLLWSILQALSSLSESEILIWETHFISQLMRQAMLKRHCRWALNQKSKQARSGTTLVELAFVAPVFLVFVYAIFEFGYAYMISNIIQEATQEGAKLGRCEDVTTAQVETRVRDLLDTVFDSNLATIMVKNASQFDTPGADVEQINFSELPDLELANAEKAQLFIVRVEVPYKDVRLLNSFFVDPVKAAEAADKEKNLVLSGHSVRRHE